MLPLLGLFLFGTLLIASVVAGISRRKWLSYTMSIVALFPLPVLGAVCGRSPADLCSAGALGLFAVLMVLHVIIRFLARRISEGPR